MTEERTVTAIRLSSEERRIIAAAALSAGLTTTAWIRMVALREAKKAKTPNSPMTRVPDVRGPRKGSEIR